MGICVNAREQRKTGENQRKERREPKRREPALTATRGGIFLWTNPDSPRPVQEISCARAYRKKRSAQRVLCRSRAQYAPDLLVTRTVAMKAVELKNKHVLLLALDGIEILREL